jgi:UDP-N-acetylglucosamine 1-carboxyvinyltransferase
MSSLKIKGGKTLGGSIPVYGSKNAALPLLAASLLSSEIVTLHNIPAIADVAKLLQIMKVMGVEIQEEGTTITVQSASMDPEQLPVELVGHLRGSILLLGSLLGRFRKVRLPLPGGDIIGARPIDVHLDAFRQLGAHAQQEHGVVTIDGSELTAGIVTLREASVTATENVMMVAAALPGTTTINIAAQEPHIVVLAELLNNMGATVTGAGTHTITIEGTNQWHPATIINIPDMLEAGLFLLLGAVTQSPLTIEHVPQSFLHLFFKKLEDIGIGWKEQGDSVTVQPGPLSSFKVQTLPYPGIATDLQAPFSVIATQAAGASLIHDPMYESRFRHCDELIKMGAAITVCDPHRVIIEGPTPLIGRHIKSLDIRSGATLIMAGLVATGETIIDDAEIIDRGYANLVERLQAVGADIERCE